MTRHALLLTSVLAAAPLAAQETTQYDCVIAPARMVLIASPVGGLLAEVLVDRGDLVEAGQVVARLDSQIEETTVDLGREQAASQAEIGAQRARLKLAESRAERTRTLVERNISSQDDLDEAEASVEVAMRELNIAEMRNRLAALELRRAEAILAQRTIQSPIDGVIVDRLLFAGEFADPDQPIVRIGQLDPLHVEAFLPVLAFSGLTTGMAAKVAPAAPVEGEFDATVTVIDRVFDAASGTFGLRAEMPNPGLEIPAGHRCLLELETPPAN